MQYAYLTMTFAAARFPGLLTVTLAVQGTLGFVPLALSELEPFGCRDPCKGNFLLIGLPSVALYAWPLGLVLRFERGAGGGGDAAGKAQLV